MFSKKSSGFQFSHTLPTGVTKEGSCFQDFSLFLFEKPCFIKMVIIKLGKNWHNWWHKCYKCIRYSFNREGEYPHPNSVWCLVSTLLSSLHPESLGAVQSPGCSQGSPNPKLSSRISRWKQVYCLLNVIMPENFPWSHYSK